MNRDVDLAQFDGAGQMIFHDATTQPDDTYSYDGNGALTKWVQTGTGAPFYYYLRSSVLGANVLELTSTGAMYKEYVFSGGGSQMAYLKDSTVTWLHEEPSGKERYEVKQDRTANWRITYDPSGAAATNTGYSGGTPCPPYTCSSPANNALMAQTNRGFDGLNRLTQQRNAEWRQSHQFEILTTPVGWFQKTKDGNWCFPGPDKPHVAGSLTPIYGMNLLFLQSSLQQTGGGNQIKHPDRWVKTFDFNKTLPLTTAQIKSLHDSIGRLITRDCADFLKKVAEELTGTKVDDAKAYIFDGFDRTKNSPSPLGFNWGGLAGFKDAGALAWFGKIGKPNANLAEIRLGDSNPVGALHKVFHVAPRASDQELSIAVQKAGFTVYTPHGATKILDFPTDADNRKLAYSSYWGQALINHCEPK